MLLAVAVEASVVSGKGLHYTQRKPVYVVRMKPCPPALDNNFREEYT